MLEGTFSLTDHNGHAVTEARYRGGFMLVYFGFTRCRKVCPRSLACMTAALDTLGETSRMVVPLYITVDPEREDILSRLRPQGPRSRRCRRLYYATHGLRLSARA